MKIDGACHCGYIRVEGDADPEKTAVCHCTDCQVGTGSAFRVNVPIPGATFRITGQPATYLKTTGPRAAIDACRRSVHAAARRFIRPRRGKGSRRPTWYGWESCTSVVTSSHAGRTGFARRCLG